MRSGVPVGVVESRLNAQFGQQLGTPLRAAITAKGKAGVRGLFIWIVVGITGGLVAHLLFDIGSQTVMQGIGLGIAIAIGMSILDRQARQDQTQPGGFYVVLGITDSHLVVFGRSLWAQNSFDVAGQVQLEEIESIMTERRWLGQAVDITLREGTQWRFEVTRFNKMQEVLPARLVG